MKSYSILSFVVIKVDITLLDIRKEIKIKKAHYKTLLNVKKHFNKDQKLIDTQGLNQKISYINYQYLYSNSKGDASI